MKRAISLLLVLVLVMCTASGCGKKNRESNYERPVPSEAVTEPTAAPTEEPAKILTADEAYAEFVKGALAVEMTTGYADLDPSITYTIGDLGNFISSEYLSYRLLPQKLESISYAKLDCGNDGKPELAVRYIYTDENYGLAPMEEVLIFGYADNKMQFITSLRSDGTRSARLNAAGYISRTDSSDENVIAIDYAYVGSDLKEQKLYSLTFALGLTEAVIPAQFLPEELMSMAGDQGEETGSIMLSLYNFSSEERGSNEYLKQNLYFFTDGDSAVQPDDAQAKGYADGGLVLSSQAEADSKANDILSAAGVTDEIKNAAGIVWNEASEEAYEEIRSGIETQLALLLNSRDTWFKTTTSGDIFFAVTDLNMDGRLELIRTEMNYNPDTTINRFWQVSADYRTLQPMEYESQFKLADGSEDPAQPSLMNMETISSYWNFSYTDYYYVFPTRTYDENGDLLRMMMLDFTDDGKVKYVCNLGEANYSYSDGSMKYRDFNGNECTEEEFNSLASGYFDFEERTWIKETVRFAFVTIKDASDLDNMLNMLYNSYTLISKETIE